MKIAVFGTRGFPLIQGGVEKHCENLYPQFSHQIKIIVFRRKAFISEENKNPHFGDNLEFIDLPSTKIKGFEAFFHSFLATMYCLIIRPDIVHIHNIGPGIFTPLLRLVNLKVVLTYHSANYEHKKWGIFGKTVLKLGEFCSTKFANKIIFVNEMVMKSFSPQIQKKSTFIPNGIKPASFTQSKDYLKTLGIDNQPYFLTVGRITPEKGFDYLIDAFNLLNANNIYLVIAGGIDHKSAYGNELLNKAKTNKRIIFTGHVEGMALEQLYNQAQLFILPSYNEGYPIVLLEAISYQLPILASDIPANKQLKLPQESYFHTGDYKELAAILEKRFSSGTKISINYKQPLYTWYDVAKRTEQIFLDIYKKDLGA